MIVLTVKNLFLILCFVSAPAVYFFYLLLSGCDFSQFLRCKKKKINQCGFLGLTASRFAASGGDLALLLLVGKIHVLVVLRCRGPADGAGISGAGGAQPLMIWPLLLCTSLISRF